MGATLKAASEERRRVPLSTAGVSIRADADSDQRFRGYACVFNVRTSIGNPLKWGFYEQCAPGMFTKTLQEGDARFLIDHNSYYVVSRTSAESLHLAEDKKGLQVDSALDDRLSYVGDLKTNVEIKNITGMSFGFFVVRDDWTTETVTTSDGNSAEVEIRTLLEVRLIEVSAVTFPQYEETEAEINSAVAIALTRRGDTAAIEKRAANEPELLALCDVVRSRTTRKTNNSDKASEPVEDTTRDADDSSDGVVAPVASTRLTPSINDRMRALATRYHLPV